MPAQSQAAEEIVRIAQTGEPQKGFKFRDLLFQHVVTYWLEPTLDNLVYAFDTLNALRPIVESEAVFPESRRYGDPSFRRHFKGWTLQHFDYKTGGFFHSLTAGWPSPYATLMVLIAVMYLADPEGVTLKRAPLRRKNFEDYLGADYVASLVAFVRRLESPTGGFSEMPSGPVGSITTSTCCEILRHLEEPLSYREDTAKLLQSPWKPYEGKYFACANSVSVEEDTPGLVPIRYNLRVWLRHLRHTAQMSEYGLATLLDVHTPQIVRFLTDCQKDGGYALSPQEVPSVVPTAHIIALHRDLGDAISDGYAPQWVLALEAMTKHDPSNTLGFLQQQSNNGFFSWTKACLPNLYSLRAAARIWSVLKQQTDMLNEAEQIRLTDLGLSMLRALQAFWQPESGLFTGYLSK